MNPEDLHPFVRHRGPITCVAGIPGTQTVVSSGYDGAIAMFDYESRHVELLGYHDHLANRIVVNKAGTKAASSSSDYTVYIWDLKTRKVERILRGHSDDAEDFVFINDSLGASVSRDWRILIWDLNAERIIRIIEGHEKDVLSVDSYDGLLFTSGDDMTLRVWDLQTGKQVKMWGPFETETDTCAIDPIHKRAVLGCDDGAIRIFDLDTGKTISEIEAHRSGIKKVAVSPASGDIFSAAYDQKIIIWSAEDLKEKVRLERHLALWERSFNWSVDGTRIFAGTFDGTVLMWDAATGKCLAEIGSSTETKGNACFNEVASSSSGEIILVSDDGYVRLGRLDRSHAEWLARVEPKSGRVLMNAATMNEAGNLVAVGAHNQTLHIYEKRNGSLQGEIEVFVAEGPINSIRVATHKNYELMLFVGCYSGAIVRVARDGRIDGKFLHHGNAVKALRLHPDEPMGVSCSADGVLVSWDLNGNILNRFLGHMAIIDDVDIDPTGKYVASTGRDFTLKVYGLHDGQLLHTVSLGRRSPKGVCFYDETTIIVSNYWGELIKVSLPEQRVLRRTIARNGISSVARSGKYVVASSYDGATYLVDPESLEVVNCLRAMTQRIAEPAYA